MTAGLLRGLPGSAARRCARGAARSVRRVIGDESGSALVEFTVLAPLLLMLWVGVLQFGPVLQNYLTLQNAVTQGVQTFAAERSVAATVYSDTINQVSAAAPSLYSGATVTLSVCNASGGSCTACTSNSTCASAIGSAQGDAAKVSATYPCGLTFKIFGFGASCTISVSADMLIR